MSAISERLRHLINSRELTQKELAEKAGVTESAMSYYVKGIRKPGSAVLGRLAKALGVTTDYLLGISEDVKNTDNERLCYLQRNLGKLDSEALKKAEKVLKAVFDEIFDDDEDEEKI